MQIQLTKGDKSLWTYKINFENQGLRIEMEPFQSNERSGMVYLQENVLKEFIEKMILIGRIKGYIE